MGFRKALTEFAVITMGPDPTPAGVDSLRVMGTEFRGTTSDLPMAILQGLLASDLLGAPSRPSR